MNSIFSLKDRNILITGASSGIGRQCAITSALLGANVILVARSETKLKAVYKELKGDNHLYYSFDVTNYLEIEEIIKDSVEKLGKISGFIHSAGMEITKPLNVMKPIDYNNLFSTNTISAFEIVKILSKKKYLFEHGASYIFISALIGLIGRSALVGYGASKGALIAGMRSLAMELVNKGIRVNCISPGFIQTEMMKKLNESLAAEEIEALKNDYPLGLGGPDDIANAAIYLLSEASRWVTGTNLIVDGGFLAK